jgi:hypothetical protein
MPSCVITDQRWVSDQQMSCDSCTCGKGDASAPSPPAEDEDANDESDGDDFFGESDDDLDADIRRRDHEWNVMQDRCVKVSSAAHRFCQRRLRIREL